MEEQMRLYIRLAMEDGGFHLRTSMDNNMYNLINVTRFPSFDTSARMRRKHMQERNLEKQAISTAQTKCSIATTFVSHRGREDQLVNPYNLLKAKREQLKDERRRKGEAIPVAEGEGVGEVQGRTCRKEIGGVGARPGAETGLG
ncbi:hypothetical protein M5K25_020629 [Dendrobium thyrsiflorum]|uniref:Uncharacterized protein n=1 Tax=Dendrobium thyrsiflorum TaxID=117978 RepID=A0ABD0UAD2_DENTH